MKRVFTLCATMAVGGLSLAAAGFGVQTADPSKAVVMQTMNVRDILYVMTGGGSNSMVLMHDDGIVLVDSKLPGWGPAVLFASGSVSDRPVKTIINTTADLDHVGGNTEHPSVAQIIAHANTKVNMQKMDTFKGANAKFLPNKTFTDKMSLLDGLDRIDLYYFGAGHTNGDIIVVFPEKHVALFGDLFPGKSAPVIDTANGGSGVAFPATLARAVAEISGVQRVITGHPSDAGAAQPRNRPRVTGAEIFANPRTMTWADVQEYTDFNRDFLAAAQQAIKSGKTVDEAAAGLTMPDRYKNYDMKQMKANIQAIYNELKK